MDSLTLPLLEKMFNEKHNIVTIKLGTYTQNVVKVGDFNQVLL